MKRHVVIGLMALMPALLIAQSTKLAPELKQSARMASNVPVIVQYKSIPLTDGSEELASGKRCRIGAATTYQRAARW